MYAPPSFLRYFSACEPGTTSSSFEKRTYKFCVRKDKEFLYFDGKRVEPRQVEYKFAIEFPSVTEPEVPAEEAEAEIPEEEAESTE